MHVFPPSPCHLKLRLLRDSVHLHPCSAFQIEDKNRQSFINVFLFLLSYLFHTNSFWPRFMDQYSQLHLRIVFVTFSVFYQREQQSCFANDVCSWKLSYPIIAALLAVSPSGIVQVIKLNPIAMALRNLIYQTAQCRVNNTYTASHQLMNINET